MKILLACDTLEYRGTPRTLVCYARMLKKRHDVLVWAMVCGGEYEKALNAEGVPICIGPDAIAQALGHKPDVFNMHRPGVPCEREREILAKFKVAGARCVETSVFGRVDPTVEDILDLSLQISKWDLYRWNAWKGKYKVPGVLMPNPVDTEAFSRVNEVKISERRQQWHVDENGVRGFVLGRIGKTDWSLLEKPLIDALDRNANLYFVHVGDYGGNLPPSIENHPHIRIQSKMLSSSELSVFYSACDACVNMNKTGESFGYVNAEAMACGTPVVTLARYFHDNAQIEMVQDGGGGIVIRKPDELPRAIERLMKDSDLRSAIQNRAPQYIERNYSIRVLADQLDLVFACAISDDIAVEVAKCAESGLLTISTSRDAMTREAGLLNRLLLRFYHSPLGCRLLMSLKTIRKFI